MKRDKSLPISKGKMSSTISEANLEKKFQAANNTQDSIQTLSLWLLHHKAHHQKIVSSWMKVLQKAKISHRLTLFYLANDVVQNSKRKSFLHFANSFAEVLKDATLLVRDDSIRPSILRVFNIWEQRNVYSPEFIADLRAILANNKVPATAPQKLLAQFKPESVIDKIRVISKLEVDVNKKINSINLSKLKATDAEIVQQFKDRIHGQQFKREFDNSAAQLDQLIKLIEKEMVERTELILLLEQSEIYYDTQKGEAKIVANAYKNFGGRIEKLQKKLEEITSSLPSPLPSPSVDAPSPTTSDQELELDLPAENPQEKELESLENAPSPEGSPEGLNLPEPDDEKEKEKLDIKNIGNPIPTLSTFFPHENKGMTSWLDTFANKKEPLKILPENNEIKNNDGGSLESRLSSLMQNIPSLPPGLQNTLFGNTTVSNSNISQGETTESAVNTKKEKGQESTSFTGVLTPVKDDYSGQNTPLQDEDTSSHSFFSKLASSNKTHSPKDILKGLTNLIQSASADKDDSHQKRDKFPPFTASDIFETQTGMPSFIKSIIPSVSKSSQVSSSPSTFFSTSQSAPSTASPRTVTGSHTTTVNSYQTVSFDSIPSYSTRSSKQGEHRSFIPSLVPSTPQENFSYTQQTFPSDEYNPEMEIFDTDVELVNPDENSHLEAPSPDRASLSPPPANHVMDIPRPVTGRRLSTLITLVTDDNPEQRLPENKSISGGYRSDKENFADDNPPWHNAPDHVTKISCDDPPWLSTSTNDIKEMDDNNPWLNTSAPISKTHCDNPPWLNTSTPVTKHSESIPITDIMADSPNEEYFIGKQVENPLSSFYLTAPPPPQPPVMSPPPNGPNSMFMDPVATSPEIPLSRIETVQSQRDHPNGRWFGDNNWSDNHRPPFSSPPPYRHGSPSGQFFNNNRNFSPRNFQPRQNWPNRGRPDRDFQQKRDHPFAPRPYGPPQNKRFSFRGRGEWGRNHPY